MSDVAAAHGFEVHQTGYGFDLLSRVNGDYGLMEVGAYWYASPPGEDFVGFDEVPALDAELLHEVGALWSPSARFLLFTQAEKAEMQAEFLASG